MTEAKTNPDQGHRSNASDTLENHANSATEKQNTCLVFGITSGLSFALGTFLIGFIKHHPDWNGFVHVFHDGVSQADQESISAIWPDVTFSLMSADGIYEKCGTSDHLSGVVHDIIQRYSVMYFAKFESFDLLQVYDKCVWFDVDMVVQKPIPDLWDFEDLAWRPVLQVTADKNKDLQLNYADILDAHPVPRPNGGLICISSSVWKRHAVDSGTLYDIFLDVSAKKNIVTGDEMSLRIMASKHRLAVKSLDKHYNCPSASPHGRSAYVVHSIGSKKFWNDGAVSAAYPSWGQYYDVWVNIGGSPYDGKFDASYIPHDPDRIIMASRKFSVRGKILEAIEPFFPDDVIIDPYHSDGGGVTCYLPNKGDCFTISINPVRLSAVSVEFEQFYLDLEVATKGHDGLRFLERQIKLMAMPDMTVTRKKISDTRVRLVRRKVSGAQLDARLAEFIKVGLVLSGKRSIFPRVLRPIAVRVYKKLFSR